MLLKDAVEAFIVLCFSRSIWDTYGTFLMNVEVTPMLVRGVHFLFRVDEGYDSFLYPRRIWALFMG